MKCAKIASVVANLILLPLCASVPAMAATEQKLTQNDGFEIGHSVAVVGNIALVGAPKSNSTTGAAYVYTRTCTTCTWTLAQRLTASDAANSDRFGDAVAFDGTTMVVGATAAAAGAGAAYTFVYSGGTWTQSQKLVAHDGALNDTFGYSIAIYGPNILVGAFNARLSTQTLGNGAVYRYYRAGSVGSAFLEAEKMTASDSAGGDEFGWSVTLSADTALIGARNVKLTADCPGVPAGNGCPQAGAVYVFDNPCATGQCLPSWPQTQRIVSPNPTAGMNYGFSVAIENTTAVVGAAYTIVNGHARQGSASVLSKAVSGWQEIQQVTSSDGAAHDWFGASVAISGGDFVVGSQFASPDSQGAAYVFRKTASTWSQTNKLGAAKPFHLGGYGISVGFSGNTALVGSPYTPDGSRGAAFSYIGP